MGIVKLTTCRDILTCAVRAGAFRIRCGELARSRELAFRIRWLFFCLKKLLTHHNMHSPHERQT
jgi:hypothetical protein